jgi:hypothetical protein
MTQAVTETRHMPGRKKENFERGRVEFLAEPAWIERVVKVADRLGLSLSSYIRMVVTRDVEREEADRPPERKKKQ